MDAYVLIVDDDEAFRETLRAMLEGEGTPTLTAADGAAALDAIGRHGLPAAIICDLRMPRMTGDEFVARLRADERTAAVPVAVVSGDLASASLPDDVARHPKPPDRNALLDFVRVARAGRARRDLAVIVASLRSALARLQPSARDGFTLLSRAVDLLDDLATRRLAPDQRAAIDAELVSTYREIARLRQDRRRRRALPAEERVDGRRQLGDTERLVQDGELRATLERGLALAERLDGG